MSSNKGEGRAKLVHNVVVTGFGLFRDHQMNPSWESIKDGRLTINRSDVNIIAKQVNVEYKEVDRVVSSLWSEYEPLLMVHVGLAANEKEIKIEQLARHGPFINDDVAHDAPHKDLREYLNRSEINPNRKSGYTCKPCEFDCDRTCIDVDNICEKMDSAFKDGLISIPVRKSQDAGLYVCEYIYHKSLQICQRAVFVHVPDVTAFKLDQITDTLSFIIESLVDDLLCDKPDPQLKVNK